MLRVNRLAAAMDIIEAGTSAPMAMAAKAKPWNQEGNTLMNRPGTAKLLPNAFVGCTPATSAMKPNSAIRPSRKEYAGNSAALRRSTRPLFEESTPVIECGYMNSANADPSASVANAKDPAFEEASGERKSLAFGTAENRAV